MAQVITHNLVAMSGRLFLSVRSCAACHRNPPRFILRAGLRLFTHTWAFRFFTVVLHVDGSPKPSNREHPRPCHATVKVRHSIPPQSRSKTAFYLQKRKMRANWLIRNEKNNTPRQTPGGRRLFNCLEDIDFSPKAGYLRRNCAGPFFCSQSWRVVAASSGVGIVIDNLFSQKRSVAKVRASANSQALISMTAATRLPDCCRYWPRTVRPTSSS